MTAKQAQSKKRREHQRSEIGVRLYGHACRSTDLDVIVYEVVHRLSVVRFEDELSLLHDVTDDDDELLI